MQTETQIQPDDVALEPKFRLPARYELATENEMKLYPRQGFSGLPCQYKQCKEGATQSPAGQGVCILASLLFFHVTKNQIQTI